MYRLTPNGTLIDPVATLDCHSCPSMFRPYRTSVPLSCSSLRTGAHYCVDNRKPVADVTLKVLVEVFWNLPPLLRPVKGAVPCSSLLQCLMSELGTALSVWHHSIVAVYMLGPNCWRLKSEPLFFSVSAWLDICRTQGALPQKSRHGGAPWPARVGSEAPSSCFLMPTPRSGLLPPRLSGLMLRSQKMVQAPFSENFWKLIPCVRMPPSMEFAVSVCTLRPNPPGPLHEALAGALTILSSHRHGGPPACGPEWTPILSP